MPYSTILPEAQVPARFIYDFWYPTHTKVLGMAMLHARSRVVLRYQPRSREQQSCGLSLQSRALCGAAYGNSQSGRYCAITWARFQSG